MSLSTLQRITRITHALEKLARIERSGVLKAPHTAESFSDVRGIPGGGSEGCAVAKFVGLHTGLRVEVCINSAGGYWCVDLDDDVPGDEARVKVPGALNDLIYEFDHGIRPWLYLNAEEY